MMKRLKKQQKKKQMFYEGQLRHLLVRIIIASKLRDNTVITITSGGVSEITPILRISE